jgi:hypothetical protein
MQPVRHLCSGCCLPLKEQGVHIHAFIVIQTLILWLSDAFKKLLYLRIEFFGSKSKHFMAIPTKLPPPNDRKKSATECDENFGERVSPSKITSLGISASRLALSHLGRENQMWCGWTWAGNWWKNKKEDGENLTLVLFSRGLRLAEAFSRSEFPSRFWSLAGEIYFYFLLRSRRCGAWSSNHDALARISLSCIYFDYTKKQWDEKRKINKQFRTVSFYLNFLLCFFWEFLHVRILHKILF